MKLGLKKLRCEACGEEKEVEVGIRTMYHCARPMEEVSEEGAKKPEIEPKKFKVGR